VHRAKDDVVEGGWEPGSVRGNMTGLVTEPATTAGVEHLYNYTWDELGRLATATRADNFAQDIEEQYTYDASGQRVMTWTHDPSLGADTYTLDVFDTLVLKNAAFNGVTYEDDNTTEQLFLGPAPGVTANVRVESSGVPTGPGPNGSTRMFMSFGDPLGSASFVIDHDTSELVEHATYMTYGAVESDFRSTRWNSPRQDIRYTGHWDNAEVGLVYFGARYYSSVVNRWISADPLTIHGLGADLNPYAFVGGSPIGTIDALGLDGCPPGSLGSECPSSGSGTGTIVAVGAIAAFPIYAGYEFATNSKWQNAAKEAWKWLRGAGSTVASAASDVGKGVAGLGKDIGWLFSHGGNIGAVPPPPIDNGSWLSGAATAVNAINHAVLAYSPLTAGYVNLVNSIATATDPSASTGSRVLAGASIVGAGIPGGEELGEFSEGVGAVAGPAARFLVGPGGAAIETGLSAADLLVPNGVRIGEAGASAGIRIIQGGPVEAGTLFEQLTAGGTPVAGNYPGTLVNLGSGGTVGLRTLATGTLARLAPAVTIDVNIPGIAIRELKFIP
jgi:RHS repeat-associated protein